MITKAEKSEIQFLRSAMLSKIQKHLHLQAQLFENLMKFSEIYSVKFSLSLTSLK